MAQDWSRLDQYLLNYVVDPSQKATVLSLYTVQVVLGSLALAMVQASVQQFFALLVIVAIFFFSFVLFLSRVEVYS